MARKMDWAKASRRDAARVSEHRGYEQRAKRSRRRAAGGGFDCLECGKPTEAVMVTDGLCEDGTVDLRVFCGNRCATKGGYAWAGLPSRFKGVTVHTVFE